MPRSQPGAPNLTLRPALIGAQLALLLGCAGPVAEFSTIPAEEAAWQAMAPRLAGMPAVAIEHCAGPLRAAIPGPGGSVLVYRDQDLKNYCQVSLLARAGRILSYSAEHTAPEFLYLRDGSNYCGRIFQR